MCLSSSESPRFDYAEMIDYVKISTGCFSIELYSSTTVNLLFAIFWDITKVSCSGPWCSGRRSPLSFCLSLLNMCIIAHLSSNLSKALSCQAFLHFLVFKTWYTSIRATTVLHNTYGCLHTTHSRAQNGKGI